jgi:hypothetical protein
MEARDAAGTWRTVYAQVGYPAGMPRQMALPIDLAKLPAGASALRLRTNQEVYWDRIAVVFAEPCEAARVTPLALTHAALREVGYPKRTTGAQRLPMYDYHDRAPYFDNRRMRGLYTRVGEVNTLVAATDGVLAIFGPGEEIHAEFDAGALEVDAGNRFFVLDSFGWCKDMDLYTQHGETVGPLPTIERPARERDALHDEYNTRYLSGP